MGGEVQFNFSYQVLATFVLLIALNEFKLLVYKRAK